MKNELRQTKFNGIYEIRKKRVSLFTKNFVPGKRVYEERLIKEKGNEYREWSPHKSKLAAAILKGINQIRIKQTDVVLYLGASTGTTCSHVSDILAKQGFIFALDFAPRVVRELVFLAEDRKNIAPILADANKPKEYVKRVSEVDYIYQDIAQKNQAEIFLKNCGVFLKKEGFCFIAVKARSVDVTKRPKVVFKEIRNKLEKELTIVDYKELDPYQKDHCVFVCKKL